MIKQKTKNKEGEKGNGNKEGKTTLISTYNQSTIDDE